MDDASNRIPQPGLRLRMGAERRRISSQHRQLDQLHERVAEALERESVAPARTALGHLRIAWEAHTSLEDGFYFPALRGLRPAVGERLAALSAEHEGFLAALAAVDEHLERGELQAAGAALEAFAARAADHERREETLLAELTGASPARGA